MSEKRVVSIHVRVCDEADAMLELLREARASDKATVASEILQRALLGEGHGLKVAAMRLARAGLMGSERE